MKKVVSNILLVLSIISAVLLVSCGGVNSGSTKIVSSELEEIKKNGVLKIGVTNYPPMNYLDDNGKWTGFDTEFAEAVCAELGVKAEFYEINWSAKETELASKNIDCLWNGMCITEDRKTMWSVTNPYMNNTQAIVMKKEREAEILVNIAGKNIVAEAGSTGEEKILGTIDDTNDNTVKVMAKDYFKNSYYVGVQSMATALNDVKNGVADAAVVDYVIALGMIRPDTDYNDLAINIDNNFGAQYFGIAFRKGSDLCDKVNDLMVQMNNSGKIKEIAQKYGIENSLMK